MVIIKPDKPRKPAYSDFIHLGAMPMVEYALSLGNNKGLDPSLLHNEEDSYDPHRGSMDSLIGDATMGHDLRKPCTKKDCKTLREKIDRLFEKREALEEEFAKAQEKFSAIQQKLNTVEESRAVLRAKEQNYKKEIDANENQIASWEAMLQNHAGDLSALHESELQTQLRLQTARFHHASSIKKLKDQMWRNAKPDDESLANSLEPLNFEMGNEDISVFTKKTKKSDLLESRYSALADVRTLDPIERPKTGDPLRRLQEVQQQLLPSLGDRASTAGSLWGPGGGGGGGSLWGPEWEDGMSAVTFGTSRAPVHRGRRPPPSAYGAHAARLGVAPGASPLGRAGHPAAAGFLASLGGGGGGGGGGLGPIAPLGRKATTGRGGFASTERIQRSQTSSKVLSHSKSMPLPFAASVGAMRNNTNRNRLRQKQLL